MDYPESEKLLKVSKFSQTCGEFLAWLETKGVLLAQYRGDQLTPFRYSTEVLLAKFFEIDLDKVEAEKRQMLESLRKNPLK